VLTKEEQTKLLAAARNGKTINGLAGEAREMVYLTALGTGFRAHELWTLTAADFHLAGPRPCITLSCSSSKRRQNDKQRINIELADILKPFIAPIPKDQQVWPSAWWRRGGELLEADLTAAGLPVETEEGIVDFHALRHTYITELVETGASMVLVQRLARLSTPLLLDRYYHDRDETKDEVIGKLRIYRPEESAGSEVA
jgi:integrase